MICFYSCLCFFVYLSQQKIYLIYIDILGFDELPTKLSDTTQLDSAYIREKFILDPVTQMLNETTKGHEFLNFTDNFLIFTPDIEKVFEIINKICKLTIPLKTPLPIEFEIAVGTAFKDPHFITIAQDNIIRELKGNLLKKYRDYVKSISDKRINKTFIVITETFYESLSNDRKLYCHRVEYQHTVFYIPENKMMTDLHGENIKLELQINKFINSIQQIGIWNFFELKAFTYKNIAEEWRVLFLYFVLLENKVPIIKPVRTSNCRMIHLVYDISELSSILENAFINNNFSFDDLIPLTSHFGNIEYGFCKYMNENEIDFPASSYGINYPCYYLKKTPNKVVTIEKEVNLISDQLKEQDPKFRKSFSTPMADVIGSFGLSFWSGNYSPFIAAFAPMKILPRFVAEGNSIKISIEISKSIDSSRVKLDLIRNGKIAVIRNTVENLKDYQVISGEVSKTQSNDDFSFIRISYNNINLLEKQI